MPVVHPKSCASFPASIAEKFVRVLDHRGKWECRCASVAQLNTWQPPSLETVSPRRRHLPTRGAQAPSRHLRHRSSRAWSAERLRWDRKDDELGVDAYCVINWPLQVEETSSSVSGW